MQCTITDYYSTEKLHVLTALSDKPEDSTDWSLDVQT